MKMTPFVARWIYLSAAAIAIVVTMSSFWVSTLGQSSVEDLYFTGASVAGEPGEVVASNMVTGEKRSFFRPSDGFRIFDIAKAPQGSLVAVQEQLVRVDVPIEQATFTASSQTGDKPGLERMILRILNVDGSHVSSLEDVRSFAWSPAGDRLAYVTGKFVGRDKEHSRTGVWIWNSSDRRTQQISSKGYFVFWAKFDGNVYTWDPVGEGTESVRRYDVATGRLELTRHKSIYFSPSGDYYYHPGGGIGLRENIYLAATDVGLADTSPALSGLGGWLPIAWSPDQDLLLMTVNRRNDGSRRLESSMAVYDPKADALSNIRVTGEVVGWGKSSSQIVVKANDQIVTTTLSR